MKKVKSFLLKEIHNLHLIFRAYRSHEGLGFWFRGQADSTWDLVPKGGRAPYYLSNNRDLGRFKFWCQQAIAYSNLPSSSIERLALAQHHGLATRLLDWTKNPLVACFFACYEHPNKDGAVYILETPKDFITENTHIGQIKVHQGIFGYIPNIITPRILNQKGMFTVHCDASHPIEIEPSRIDGEDTNITQIVIPASLKLDLIEVLGDYGIDRAFLFPDLDGLSDHVNHSTKKLNTATQKY